MEHPAGYLGEYPISKISIVGDLTSSEVYRVVRRFPPSLFDVIRGIILLERNGGPKTLRMYWGVFETRKALVTWEFNDGHMIYADVWKR